MKLISDDGVVVIEAIGSRLEVKVHGNVFVSAFNGDLISSIGHAIVNAHEKTASVEKTTAVVQESQGLTSTESSTEASIEASSEAAPFGSDAEKPTATFKSLSYAACVFDSVPKDSDIEAARKELYELVSLTSEDDAEKVRVLLCGTPFLAGKTALFKAEIESDSEQSHSAWLDNVVDALEQIPEMQDMGVKFAFVGPREVVMSAVNDFNKNGASPKAAPHG